MSADTALDMQLVQRWMAQDPDPVTVAALQELLDTNDQAQLQELFAGRLEFGTAGLRAEVGPGPLRMNRLVVAQTAAGINAWLAERIDGPANIVVGFDARLSSAGFAETVSGICAAAGHHVRTYSAPIPTPVLAYAVNRHNADVGIMITASHNPAADNGLKVYLGGRLGNGAQLNAPHDQEIAAAILAVAEQDLPDSSDVPTPEDPAELIDQYAHELATKMATPNGDLPFVYTAMHGVGYRAFAAALAKSVFSGLIPVPEQLHPDGNFPTTSFPNPELPGVLDLAISVADQAKIPMVLAHDPDADRCAVAFRDTDGQYRQLTGDQTGMLIAGWLVDTEQATAGDVFALSLVSHSALPALGAAHGIEVNRTLTGFKWIAATDNLRYGYEEAIGFCLFPNIVRDKDGISAALALVEIYHWLYERETNAFEYLDQLARRYGHTHSAQLTLPLAAADQASDITGGLLRRLEQLADLPVRLAYDLRSPASGLPPTPGILLEAGDESLGARVIMRPSGTEPKLKIYLHTWAPAEGRSSNLLNVLTDQMTTILETEGAQ
ncbi:phospho-sugar mutase [Micrococcoides hystricis]|uniref:Phospho-sugar mutase n=1 Tax=Micrococcoides hystricis TaxID=1572761 RepID=A0ABV6PAC0_9MICC